MFESVGCVRFAEITAASRTGNRQKGHGVSFADWDRDGDVDLFIEMVGALNGNPYNDICFQNPRPGEPLADRHARRAENQSAGRRRPNREYKTSVIRDRFGPALCEITPTTLFRASRTSWVLRRH